MQEATLGVVVQQLVQAVQHHTTEKGNLESARRKLDTVKTLDTKSLEQVLLEYFANQFSTYFDRIIILLFVFFVVLTPVCEHQRFR